MKKFHYEKNSQLLEHKVNRTFDEVLAFNDTEFRDWVIELRTVIVDLWDKDGLPPVVGRSTDDILSDFDRLASFNSDDLLIRSDSSVECDVIRNTFNFDSAINQWFPTMMKTKINCAENLETGKSIYDFLKQDELLETMINYCKRHYKRDSFYNYSKQVPTSAADLKTFLFSCKTGREWIEAFNNHQSSNTKHDYWLSPLSDEDEYTGYQGNKVPQASLTLSWVDVLSLGIPSRCLGNVSLINTDQSFAIRVYEKGQRIFPAGLTAFRNSYGRAPSNFRPLTAKLIYERYLRKLGITKATIWDPSAGWGGRILGAMAIREGYNVHYIGTDPNTDHTTENNRTKYHEVAEFYNKLRTGRMPGYAKLRFLCQEPHTYEIYQCGSEVMSNKETFQIYKGKIDIVFTSPPYFSKELYSEDAGQSANKFTDYESWRDGFLEPTLRTASEWLRPGGYLAWNIADVKYGKKILPLEADSCQILEDLGMEKVEVLKMLLAPAPGANRIRKSDSKTQGPSKSKNQTPQGTAKNSLQITIDGVETTQKFEPIFVYRKPILEATEVKKAVSTKDRNSKILPYLDQRAYALEVETFLHDFINKLEASIIKPDELRGVYAKFKKRISACPVKDFYEYFNSGYTNLSKKEGWAVCSYTKPPLFIKPRLGNATLQSLAGKYALLQRANTNLTNCPSPHYAWARILDSESTETTIWVEVEESPEFAERYRGLVIDVSPLSILRIESKPIPFQLKKGR